MSDDLGFPHDHGEVAWGHFLAQHVGKKNTEDFVLAFYKTLNKLDITLSEMYTLRWLDTPIGGVVLDGIGSIVGVTREVPNAVYTPFFGFNSQPSGRAFGVARIRRDHESYRTSNQLADVEYLRVIINKIALNNGHGTAEEIMYSVGAALDLENIRIFDIGDANANLYITELLTPDDPKFYIIEQLLPRAAGVKIWPYLVDPIYTFGFIEQKRYYGFDIGVIARRPESNISGQNYSGWDGFQSQWDNNATLWDRR